MRVVIVYESMFGCTHAVADAIAAGFDPTDSVVVLPVAEATNEVIADADLLVVGGPTHMHGMSRARSRRMAGEMARKPDSGLTLEPGAEGIGLREWLDVIRHVEGRAAAFDTRMHGPSPFTGRASKRIGRLLRRHGARIVARPQSFLVDKAQHLDSGETDRARDWGRQLARVVGQSARARHVTA